MKSNERQRNNNYGLKGDCEDTTASRHENISVEQYMRFLDHV